MQTFLPYQNFYKCAKCLDNKRLGKQRVEVKQIYLALTKGSRWENHPIVKMWKGYEEALLFYGIVICKEWKNRGFKDNLLQEFEEEFTKYSNGVFPNWLGNEEFHKSHRLNLLFKNPEHYVQYFDEDVPTTKPEYVWIKEG